MANNKPNLLFVFADQLRASSVGYAGEEEVLTPNLDAFAKTGAIYKNAVSMLPVCGPFRGSLITGRTPTTTGLVINDIPLRTDEISIAHCFKNAGYDTAYIGKWHLHDRETKGPVPASARFGYQYWLASNVLEFTSDAYNTVLYDNEDQEVRLPGYRVDAVTDAAIRYIDERGDDPFFLFVSYIEPHHQNHLDDYPPPDGYREAFTGGWIPPDLAALGGSTHQHLGGYFGMVKRLDEAYGRLHDALKSLALDEDTIVLFTSDHGCHFKTRNGEYKRSCHESSIRVPTTITGPGFRGGGQLQQLISLIDLPPTLLHAAGLAVPQQMQGHSLMPLLRANEADWPEEVFIQISEAQVGRAVRTQRWKYGVDAPEAHGKGVAGADEYEEQYLYDLQVDPYELNNLIGLNSHREVAQIMKARLLRRMEAAGETPPRIIEAPEGRTGQRTVNVEEAHS